MVTVHRILADPVGKLFSAALKLRRDVVLYSLSDSGWCWVFSLKVWSVGFLIGWPFIVHEMLGFGFEQQLVHDRFSRSPKKAEWLLVRIGCVDGKAIAIDSIIFIFLRFRLSFLTDDLY